MPKTKSELSQLQAKIREYNKAVQLVIKEGIVKNRERRLMKIKLKDENKQAYTLEQLQNAMKTNKHYLLYVQDPEKFVDILRGESTKKQSKNQVPLGVQSAVSNIEILATPKQSKKIEPVPWPLLQMRELYRAKNKLKFNPLGYEGFDKWLESQSVKFHENYKPSKDNMQEAVAQYISKLSANIYMGE